MQKNSESRSVGRPALPPASKLRPVGIPLSADQIETIRAAAALAGEPLTVFVRTAALDRAARLRRKMEPKSLR